MKRIYLLLIVLLAALLSLSNVFAQDYTRWRLPEGAEARFGKGWINDMRFSPDGALVSVELRSVFGSMMSVPGKRVNLFTGDMSGANAIAYTSDGDTLAVAHWDRNSWLMGCQLSPSNSTVLHLHWTSRADLRCRYFPQRQDDCQWRCRQNQ